MEKRYTVAQAVKLTGVKSYVLRYWEEEMEMTIGRNELGHRCYTGYDIQLFLNIKELKKKGLQLKAIKDLLPGPADRAEAGEGPGALGEEEKPEEGEASPEEASLKDAAQKNPKILEFQDILERLITQELHAKREGEDRWRSIDEAIRRQQLARKEAAASGEKKNRKKSRNENT